MITIMLCSHGDSLRERRKQFTMLVVVPIMCGAIAIVTLSVAIATDHWLYTWDREEDTSKDNGIFLI